MLILGSLLNLLHDDGGTRALTGAYARRVCVLPQESGIYRSLFRRRTESGNVSRQAAGEGAAGSCFH
jgi:hypothetical protein